MGILNSLFERRKWPNVGDDFWYNPLSMSVTTTSGVKVDGMLALQQATVYACVEVLAQSMMCLPIHLYRRLDGNSKERAVDHHLYSKIHDAPNPSISSPQYVETMMFHLTLKGNHYSEKVFDRRGQVVSLVPWDPNRTTVEQTDSGRLQYKLDQSDGKPKVLPAESMVHIPAMAWDGVNGLSPIAYQRETIGLAVAQRDYGARFYGQGTNMGHIFTLKEGNTMDQESMTKFMEDLKEKYQGLGKAHKAMVLPFGMEVHNVGIPPEDAQFLESRKFDKTEVASIFRVPLVLLQMHEGSTSWGTGIEQMMLGFVTFTLAPWMRRIETSLDRQLLTEEERTEYFFQFLADGLMRGDNAGRAAYFSQALNGMWMTRNEVRQRENLNPVEGGDEFTPPANIFGNAPATGATGGNPRHQHRGEVRVLPPRRQTIQRSYRRVIASTMTRVMRRERNDIMAAAKSKLRRRGVGDFRDWLTDFYAEHAEFTREQIEPAFRALAEAVGAEAMREIDQEWKFNAELEEWLTGYIDRFATQYSDASREQLLALLDDATAAGSDLEGVLGERFDEWAGEVTGTSRADKIAGWESVNLGEAFSRAVWIAASVSYMVWVASGDETCPFCSRMDGRRIRISESFLDAGDKLEGGGGEPLMPSRNVMHPPLHAGCDCVLMPD